MTTDDEIRDKKLQYNFERKPVRILALLPCRLDKYEYLTGEEVLPLNQSRVKEQANFT